MMQQLKILIHKQWKRFAVLSLFGVFLYCFVFFISYVSNPQEAVFYFGRRYGFVINAILFITENVLSYFFLIFYIILPVIREGKWKKPILCFIILYLIKFSYGYFDSLETNSMHSVRHIQDSKTLIPEDSFAWFMLWFIVFSIFDILICIGASLTIEWWHRKRQQIVLEKQRAQAELSALKHQINPHFLFNSLSFIYSKSIRLDEDLAKAVLLLSDIMRYALTVEEDKEGKVVLEKEIVHLQNIIEINQKRLNNRLNIKYDDQVKNKQLKVIPLVLITLVENAFKHGDLLDVKYPLEINLLEQDQHFFFSIKNKKGEGRKELSNGIGLSNIRQRLHLIYGDKHRFVVQEDKATFSVLLQIPIEQ
ncbi:MULTISPECIES: sensor histidine kinase [Olivibacter]|uniref:Sensor histidine kinase n=2 Tax=Sphingobacteriaceae TaxID=84566 RepID=A0ABW6AX18_9SPHI|nr:histidine kinase [Olivibacter sp. UJ_SKK_5.1]MDX3913062.1 histidine kinase [Pseudosphingobacterium sp.]